MRRGYCACSVSVVLGVVLLGAAAWAGLNFDAALRPEKLPTLKELPRLGDPAAVQLEVDQDLAGTGVHREDRALDDPRPALEGFDEVPPRRAMVHSQGATVDPAANPFPDHPGEVVLDREVQVVLGAGNREDPEAIGDRLESEGRGLVGRRR